jgi:kumamolisin
VRYGFPAITAQSPFWIAILELGGGWSAKDLQQYCDQLGIAVPPTQEITLPGGDGKFTGQGADGEYALDMQVLL